MNAVPRDNNKQLYFTGSPEEFEAKCETLHGADKRSESMRMIFIVMAVLGGALLFIGFVSEQMPMIGAGAVMAAVFGIAAYVAGTGDIEDRKLEMPRTLIEALKAELRPGRPVQVDIDFRGYWRYDPGDSWLTVKLTLVNGVVAQVSARDSCKRKVRHKRKYTKIKDKIVETLVVRLVPPKGQTLDTGLSVERRPISVGSLSLRQARVTPRAATFVFATPQILRNKDRSGWHDGGYAQMPDGADAVRSVIASYHLLGRAGARAAT